ncbi:hypothetical protein [Chromobacterium haemolyticum]|uniref:hypothetical protein n=1 Tax=Chromobacterium haemolyticum TaxID=394935 RepID=UPI0011B2565D|nr:hypothetical protein [Chromobacterium haemolyticum]
MTSGILRQPLRALLLPTRSGTEAACARVLKRELIHLNIAPSDFLNWVELQLQNWQSEKSASRDLKRVVQAVICASIEYSSQTVSSHGNNLSESYFDLHIKLINDHMMNHEEATSFLSHAFLIGHLAEFEHLSAAQIANVLSLRDSRTKFSRQSIAAVLQAMRIETGVSIVDIKSLYKRDASQELKILADADLITAAEYVSFSAEKLGFPGDLFSALKTLAPTDDLGGTKSPFTPYLQILHYQCSLAEFVDHAVTDVYEFSPRGEKGEWLHKKYPNSIAGAANPFLNNAKSVEVLNISWVRAKKTKERPGAMALLVILEGLQAMGFSARRELAWWIRIWLHRIIRSVQVDVTAIPDTLSDLQIEKLIQAIKRGNTKTFGVLEQRVIDAVATTIHSIGWRPKGIGDSVNATNISSAKFGDCDFLNIESKTIHAYESHSGSLSSTYVEQHLASLRKSIPRRINELTSVADIQDWDTTIHFVAHHIGPHIPSEFNLHGLKIQIHATTFSDFFDQHVPQPISHLATAIHQHLLLPLNAHRTPNEVRQRLLEIIRNPEI